MTLSKKTVDFDISIKADAEEGTFSAYGNTFGVVDNANEKSIPGAFVECIKNYERDGKMPKFLGQHGHKTNPIGIITKMVEDEKGLLFEGKFCLETQEGREAHALCKMGAMDSFSIGYIVEKDEHKMGVRELHKMNVKEISLVTFACNEQSLIQSIKSAIDDGEDPTVRQVQDVLREAGLSKRQAAAAVNAVKSVNTAEVEMKTAKEKFEVKRSTHELVIDIGLETKKDDMSLRDYACMVSTAVISAYETEDRWAYCEAIYMDYVILMVFEEDDGAYEEYYVRIPYGVSDGNNVMVGAAVKVKRIVKWLSDAEQVSMGMLEDTLEPRATFVEEDEETSESSETEEEKSFKTEDITSWFKKEEKSVDLSEISTWFDK